MTKIRKSKWASMPREITKEDTYVRKGMKVRVYISMVEMLRRSLILILRCLKAWMTVGP